MSPPPFFFSVFFETWFLCVTSLTILELAPETRQPEHKEIHLPLPSQRWIKGVPPQLAEIVLFLCVCVFPRPEDIMRSFGARVTGVRELPKRVVGSKLMT